MTNSMYLDQPSKCFSLCPFFRDILYIHFENISFPTKDLKKKVHHLRFYHYMSYSFGISGLGLGATCSGFGEGSCLIVLWLTGLDVLILKEPGEDAEPPPNLILSFCRGKTDGDSSRLSFSRSRSFFSL